jgi:hypothetical protein
MAKAAKRNMEKRKRWPAESLGKNHPATIDAIGPKDGGLANVSRIDHKRYNKLVCRMVQEEGDGFEPEKDEESTTAKSDEALPGRSFLQNERK